jgi:hypothetical protein
MTISKWWANPWSNENSVDRRDAIWLETLNFCMVYQCISQTLIARHNNLMVHSDWWSNIMVISFLLSWCPSFCAIGAPAMEHLCTPLWETGAIHQLQYLTSAPDREVKLQVTSTFNRSTDGNLSGKPWFYHVKCIKCGGVLIQLQPGRFLSCPMGPTADTLEPCTTEAASRTWVWRCFTYLGSRRFWKWVTLWQTNTTMKNNHF